MQLSKATITLGVLALALAACGGGGGEEAAGPKPGSGEWYLQAAIENLDGGDFAKAVEHLGSASSQEGEIQNRAIVYRTAVLAGLARGYMDIGDAIRSAILEEPAREADYRNAIQQIDRDARQYAIALAESLGQADRAMSSDPVALDFPFPTGSAGESNLVMTIASGQPVNAGQLTDATQQAIRRALILTAAELSGNGDTPAAAKTAYDAGGVKVSQTDARMTTAKLLLDASLVFSLKRVNQPDIRKILIERAEAWSKPYVESEDEALKARAEEFQQEIDDERRDMERKPRKLEKRK